MTNTELTNYLSNKQCCLETLTMENLDSLKIGNKDARCKQKELIFGNILFEVLSCTKPGATVSQYRECAAVDYIYNTGAFTKTITGMYGLITVLPTTTVNANDTPINFFSTIADAINSVTSISGFSAEVILNNSGNNVCLITYSPSSEDVIVTYTNVRNGVTTVGSRTFTGGQAADEDCLTTEDVCNITPYLNKICESC